MLIMGCAGEEFCPQVDAAIRASGLRIDEIITIAAPGVPQTGAIWAELHQVPWWRCAEDYALECADAVIEVSRIPVVS